MNAFGIRGLLAVAVTISAISEQPAFGSNPAAALHSGQRTPAPVNDLAKKLHIRCVETVGRVEADADIMIPHRAWTWGLNFERSRQQVGQLRSDIASLHDCESEFEASLTAEQKSLVGDKLARLSALWEHLDRDSLSLDLELRKGYPTRWHVAKDAGDMQKEAVKWRTLYDRVARAIGLNP